MSPRLILAVLTFFFAFAAFVVEVITESEVSQLVGALTIVAALARWVFIFYR